MDRDSWIACGLIALISAWEFWRIRRDDKEMEEFVREQETLESASRRAGAIAALEALRCWNDGTHAPECLTLDADEREMFGLCPRCRALAELRKEGRG